MYHLRKFSKRKEAISKKWKDLLGARESWPRTITSETNYDELFKGKENTLQSLQTISWKTKAWELDSSDFSKTICKVK